MGGTRVRPVPDKDRTPENDERDERDERDARDDDKAAEKADGREEADEAESVKASAAGDEDVERKDEAAARVAAALGVDEPSEGEAAAEAEAEPEEKKAKPNRAARRREEARKRRGEEELPRDKNARAKELLKRRQSQASERQGKVSSQLEASEMVEDVVARAGSGLRKWVVKNFAMLQAGVVIALLVTGGVLFYLSRAEEKGGAVSDALAAAVATDQGRVLAEDKRSDEEKELDPSKVFKTPEERADAALEAYKKVAAEHPGTGAAILARLGQAGVLLDKKQWDEALAAYSEVASSTLAGADADVKGRAVEGLGFVKEGKGDLDGALVHFKELESIDVKGFKELGMYHQARIHLAKSDKEKAKELLKAVREKLTAGGTSEKTSAYLEAVVDTALRELDPSAVPAQMPLGGGPKGSAMTPEELQRLIQKAQQDAQKKMGGQ